MASRKYCFVIMPFSETGAKRAKHTTAYWDNFFFGFIKPAAERLGYTCKRSSAQPGNIMKAIVNELVTSDVVLAVLTDYNPNVLYELGTRHSLKHGTIMMLESGQDIPFDIKQYGVIYYDDKASGVPKFEENLRNAIQKIESNGPDSPVLDFRNKHERSFNDTPSASHRLSLFDKRQVIYNDLDKNIFSPLLDYELETRYDYPISLLTLNYDLSSLKENPDYEEAKLHWEQDLKDIGIDPEVIEAQVKALNEDVDMFFTSQVRERVIAAITTDGKLTAFESRTDVPPLNHISIPNVIKQLQSDWIENTRVSFSF
jgi:hypothetical protein